MAHVNLPLPAHPHRVGLSGEGTDVEYVTMPQRTDLVQREGDDGHRGSVARQEFHLNPGAVAVQVHDGSHVPGFEAVVGEGVEQHDGFELSNTSVQ